MNKKEIQDRLDIINNKIADLNKEKDELIKEQMTLVDLTFEEKFVIWINNGNPKHLDWIINENEYPKSRAWMDKYRDMNRYQTYNLADVLEEEIEYLCYMTDEEKEECKEYFDENKKRLDEVREVMQEMMNKNFISFKCDW